MNVRRRTVIAALSVALAAGLAGCGDDKESADVTAACKAQADVIAGFTTLFTTVPEPPEDGPPPPEFAGQVQSVFDANIAVPLAALVANAPDEIKDEVDEIALKSKEFRDSADPSTIDSDDFSTLTDTVDAYMQENCTGTKVKVEAVNYAYKDLPATLAAGLVRIELEDTATEAHEMVLFTRKAGVTDSWDAILALPDDQMEPKVNFIDATSTDPGQSGYLVTDPAAGRLPLRVRLRQGHHRRRRRQGGRAPLHPRHEAGGEGRLTAV